MADFPEFAEARFKEIQEEMKAAIEEEKLKQQNPGNINLNEAK
jgi:hypothetical protein